MGRAGPGSAPATPQGEMVEAPLVPTAVTALLSHSVEEQMELQKGTGPPCAEMPGQGSEQHQRGQASVATWPLPLWLWPWGCGLRAGPAGGEVRQPSKEAWARGASQSRGTLPRSGGAKGQSLRPLLHKGWALSPGLWSYRAQGGGRLPEAPPR